MVFLKLTPRSNDYIMSYEIKEEGKFKFIEEGEGETLLLLHGLFGTLSNWGGVVEHFKKNYKVIIPMMPIYTMPITDATIKGLKKFIEKFVKLKGLTNLNIIGNSLGGHIGLVYCLKHPENVRSLALTGSSGLFENSMGGSFPRRSSYEFIAERVGYTFYDPKIATKSLIDDVFDVTKSTQKCLRMISIARSAQRNNLTKDLPKISIPTLLIWGLNDTITPPMVAHEFDRLIPNTTLKFIDKCGHAPMMEHPETFNTYFEEFIIEHGSR